MTRSWDVDRLVAAFGLPKDAHVNQRVPKKLLLENAAQSAADKRHINDVIEDIHWLAALKPNTVGVPEYRSEAREYMEIAVLKVTLRESAKLEQLRALVHRAVPYPLILVLDCDNDLNLSLAHKRWAQNEAGKVVLDGEIIEVCLTKNDDAQFMPQFLDALMLGTQARAHLLSLYQGWMDTLLAYQVAARTGHFARADSPEHALARRQALRDYQGLDARMTALRSEAGKARQLARQVELNLEIQQVQRKMAAAEAKL